MNRMIRSLLSLLLVLLMLVPLCATAFAAKATCAEDLRLKPYSFPTDQYYECGPNDTWVFTVQIAAGGSYQGAIDRANGLIAKGLDGFVYKENGMYYVMSGKFSTDYEALCYGELIHTDPKEYSAFQTSVAIPKKAIDTFQGILYAHVGVNWDSKAMETHWEDPSGAYFRADGEDYVEVYTVQFSRGTCFSRSETLRDRMERYGYPAFVYKVDMSYRTMTGMFLDRSEAKRYCKLIRRNTNEVDAIVKSAMVPESELESFLDWWSEQK